MTEDIMAKFYSDLFKLPEDERIDLIGRYIIEHDKVVSILTDAEEGKLDRYVEKLTTRFPSVEVFETGDGITSNIVYFKARKKAH